MEVLYHLVLPGDDAFFDIDALAQELDAHPTAFRDPDPENAEIVYWICHSPEFAQIKEAEFKASKKRTGAVLGSITLRPTFITVDQETVKETMDQMAKFLIPLIRRHRCQIINEYNKDVTERYRDHPERLFDPSWVPPEPPSQVRWL